MIRNFTSRILAVLFFIFFCFVSCEKDEVEPVVEESFFPRLKGAAITSKDLSSNPLAYRRLMDYLEKPIAKSTIGIELDTTFIRFIETDSYKSYTFKIKQDSLDRSRTLKNFVLTYVNDTIQIQQLVDYPVLESGALDMENIVSVRLFGDELLNPFTAKCSSGGPSYYQYEYQYCYPVYCSISGLHGPGEPCTIDGVQRGYTNCVTRWQTVFVDQGSCESITISDGNPSGGGGGANTPSDDDDNIIIIPANPTDPENPCPNNSLSEGGGDCMIVNDEPEDQLPDPVINELNNLIKKDTSFVKIKDVVNLMKTKTTDSVEYSLSLYKDLVGGEEFTKRRTTQLVRHKSLTSGYVNIGSFDFCNIHTHPLGTHGMFSFQDIVTLKTMHDSLN